MYQTTIVLLWSLCVKPSVGSNVIDHYSYDGIHAEDYCHRTDSCPEGTHVMCMYYDAKKEMGPQCVQPQNVTITPKLASTLLHLVNAIRSKVAFGKETGLKHKRNDPPQPLPRAYGMYKLQWDSELATFAQVLGNQCVMKFDLCRATKRFSDPSQMLGLIRFTYPEWYMVKHNTFNSTGLTPEKIHHAVVTAVKNWYMLKQYVNPDLIKSYPDTTNKNVDRSHLNAKPYLEMVAGEATHMGCGLSAYTEYSYRDYGLLFNSVQIICNYSAKPKKGKPVYTITPPTLEGYTVRCGCPEGYDEDADCLCYEAPSAKTALCDKMAGCKPSVVLLPIFTVEDAPKELPATTFNHNSEEYPNRTTLREGAGDDIFAQYDINENYQDMDFPAKHVMLEATLPATSPSYRIRENGYYQNNVARLVETNASPEPIVRPMKNQEHLSYRIHYGQEPKPIRKIAKMTVQKRYFNTNSVKPGNWRQSVVRPGDRTYLNPKKQAAVRSSIFSRAPKFQLPVGKRGNLSPYKIKINSFKRNMDVTPRKDFTYSRKLLDKYIIKVRGQDNIHKKSQIQLKPKDLLLQYKETSTQTVDKSGINQYLNNKFHYTDFNVTNEGLKNYATIKSSTEESDKKVMNLLDTLEREVKHIDLDVTGKEMFDAKIRKIYGTVVGKSTDMLKSTNVKTTKVGHNDLNSYDLNKYYSDIKKRTSVDNIDDPIATAEKRIFDSEDKITELNSKFPDKYLQAKTSKLRSSSSNKNTLVPLDGKDIINNLETLNKITSIDEEMKKLNYLRNTLSSDDEKSRTISLDDNINKRFEDDLTHISIDKINANTLRSNKQTYDKSDLKSRNTLDRMYRETNKHPSYEEMRFSDVETPYKKRQIDSDNEFKTRNAYRNEITKIKAYEDLMKSKGHYKDYDDRGKSRFDDEIRNRNYKDYEMGNKDNNDDPIGFERRQYYQEKLENLERKLQSARASRRLDHEAERARRLMHPPVRREDVQMRPSRTKNQLNIYLPDRARFLHGF